MRQNQKTGPLYTSVSDKEDKGKLVYLADFLSRRDFIYLVFVLSMIQHLDWFLWLSAIGSPAFFAALLWIYVKEQYFLGNKKI